MGYNDLTPFEEGCAERIEWIGLRAADLVCDGFHRDTARTIAIREWEDGTFYANSRQFYRWSHMNANV